MFILDDITMVDIGVTTIKEITTHNKQLSQLKNELTEYIKINFDSTFYESDKDAEFNFERFSHKLIKELFPEMINYIIDFDCDKEVLLKSIKSKGKEYASAFNSINGKIIEKYIDDTLNIIRNYYKNNLDDNTKLAISFILDKIERRLAEQSRDINAIFNKWYRRYRQNRNMP